MALGTPVELNIDLHTLGVSALHTRYPKAALRNPNRNYKKNNERTIMRITKFYLLLLCCSLPYTLSSCASTAVSGNVYSTTQTGVMQDVQFGEVLSVRNVIIQQNSAETGQTAGGIIGALAGSEVGKGKGKIVGGVVGTVTGGAIGSIIDRSAQEEPGIEVTIKLESGRTVAIVQLAGEVFKTGEKIKVLTAQDGKTRVTH